MALAHLKEYWYQQVNSRAVWPHSSLVYIFSEEVRSKLQRVLSLDEKPDFALIQNGLVEAGARRVFSGDDTRYTLFVWTEKNGKKVPKVLPKICLQQWKTFRRPTRKKAWDTQNFLLTKKRSKDESLQKDSVTL